MGTPYEQPQLRVTVTITSNCTYCGAHRARIDIGENAYGSLEPSQVGSICPHLELVLMNYNSRAAIARKA